MKQQEIFKGGGITGATLKWLAIISMFIDHFAAGFIRYDSNFLSLFGGNLYPMGRFIGRLAFPIFSFLIIQGYQHTSNRRKYINQLFLFALLSEVPFDLAFMNGLVDWSHQNIFFTLAVGVAGFSILEKAEEEQQMIKGIIVVLVTMYIAEYLNFDYGLYGILTIFGLGYLRNNKIPQTIFGILMGLVQGLGAALAYIPIWFYNGQRGKQYKWFFYLFYPGHLLLIYLLRILFLF